MPSTTGYILVSANTEYASIDTTLLKAGSFEEVYPEFINKVGRTQGEWFSGLSRDDLPGDMRNTFEEKENEMLKFLHETPLSEVKKIMDPVEIPIGSKNVDAPIWTSFNGWDWDWAIGFTFKVKGPYLYPGKPGRGGQSEPICSYWAEDTTDEYYGTNISLMKL